MCALEKQNIPPYPVVTLLSLLKQYWQQEWAKTLEATLDKIAFTKFIVFKLEKKKKWSFYHVNGLVSPHSNMTYWFNKCGYLAFPWELGIIYNIYFHKQQPTPVLLPGKSHGWRSMVGYGPWGSRVRHDWAMSLSLYNVSLFVEFFLGIKYS